MRTGSDETGRLTTKGTKEEFNHRDHRDHREIETERKEQKSA
jgi:hypothetical protein